MSAVIYIHDIIICKKESVCGCVSDGTIRLNKRCGQLISKVIMTYFIQLFHLTEEHEGRI